MARIQKTNGTVTVLIEEASDLNLSTLPEWQQECLSTNLPVRITIDGYYQGDPHVTFAPTMKAAKLRANRYCKGGEWMPVL